MGADGHATETGAAVTLLWHVGAGRSRAADDRGRPVRAVSLADLTEPAGEGVQALGS